MYTGPAILILTPVLLPLMKSIRFVTPPFIVAFFFALMLITFIPAISLTLLG